MKKESNRGNEVEAKPTKWWHFKLLTGGQSPFGKPYPINASLQPATTGTKNQTQK